MKITKVKTEEKSNARGVAWYLRDRWEAIANNRLMLPILLMVGFVLSFGIPQFNLVNPYVQIIIMYIGINIILTTSLNIVNGYMGEFSICLLYTSDAADDLLCVDLGGRRIIKKKKI